ncbi:hypothetical protein PanWU01x14_018830 [Parasponia andersonii]|uniref:Uncharacterized protein n=1 Tax=Parasponia andersonii TaxID=3476 RepID=A0A2P5DZA3_PARAD|nr:hypothetical protein PanWU01x14_018830 [Parasponia andersonii]
MAHAKGMGNRQTPIITPQQSKKRQSLEHVTVRESKQRKTRSNFTGPATSFMRSSKSCANDLETWRRQKFRNISKTILNIRTELKALYSGDANTKFFHSKFSQRKKKNLITGIEDEDERWRAKTEGFSSVIEQYFSEICNSHRLSEEELNQVLQDVEHRVSDEMN